ncbi:MAG: glutathione S-transferase domain-containing protein, partial [Pseudolabrys sp.]
LDETLGPALRAAIVTPLFQHDPDIALRVLTTGMGGKAYRTLRPLLRIFPTFYRFRHRIRESNLERDRAIVAVALDRIEHERQGRAYLVGETFTVADLTAAALLGGAPAASRDSVPTAGGVTVVSAGVPRNAAAASSRAMGRRHLPPASRTLAAIAKRMGAP